MNDAPDNPLLDQSGLPRFDAICADDVVPGIRALLAELHVDLDALECNCRPEWSGVVEGVERLSDRLGYAWNVICHLMGVKSSPQLRSAHADVQPEVVGFQMRLAQSAAIYRALRELRAGQAWDALDLAQRRVVETLLRDAELAGAGLEGAARERFNAIETELSRLATAFENNVLDATKAFALDLSRPDEVEGLPPSLLALAAQTARAAGAEGATLEGGPWRITLDQPSATPFLMYSRRRDLREQVYRARVRRASVDPLDNAPVIERMLRLRREKAHLLGFETYADLSLASKMAPDVPAVRAFEDVLRSASRPAAESDLANLIALAARAGAPEAGDFQPWDLGFWEERERKERFDFSDEELRPYFPFPQVLEGLFALAHRLFGVAFVAADGDAPVWHPDVRFFRVYDDAGTELGALYLDPFSRPAEKNGGAWMDASVGRSRLASTPDRIVRLPAAFLMCNGTPPLGGRPSLMAFWEVETLFHEFGHGLQHILTTVDCGLAAGLRGVEWDAVEIPSLFMENWCYDRDTLRAISGHVDTRDPLPDELYRRIDAFRTWRMGSVMLAQVAVDLIDLELHGLYDPDAPGAASPLAVAHDIARRIWVLPPVPGGRELCSLTHIFAGAYAAGHYSYRWSEVLSADAFSAFVEAPLGDPVAVAAVGRRFRDTFLARGGGQHPMEVFREFRGREPSIGPLLRRYGLAPSEPV